MYYESLLVKNGGGIVSRQSISPRYKEASALIIGLGGTGLRAVQTVKEKVFAQIEPDEPAPAPKRYSHIQFLAIDADETDVQSMSGEARIDPGDEFQSLTMPTLATALLKKQMIKDNPLCAWMDIDRIDHLVGNQGAGGIRQVGRYLLFQKVDDLRSKIELKIRNAMEDQTPAHIDIYIMAGISGGTGSGCFIDTCYIVRDIVEKMGIDGKLYGLFFLPDVVISKPKVASNTSAVSWNQVNGYSALKELDYLMGLSEAGERFHQNYGTFSIDTDRQPVDMCYLLSAKNSDGVTEAGAFEKSVNVAADFVVSYLSEVNVSTGKGATSGLTIRGNDANITAGVNGLNRKHGANLYYHVLGAAEASVPFSQIMTYLACRLFSKFDTMVGRDKKSPVKDDVVQLADSLGMGANSLYQKLNDGAQELYLPSFEEDLKLLKGMGVLDRERYPKEWADASNNWHDHCAGKRKGNMAGVAEPLISSRAPGSRATADVFDYKNVQADSSSIVTQVFIRLCRMAMDRNFGPYYAAALLRGGGYTLRSYLEGVATEATEYADTCRFNLNTSDYPRKQEANAKFVRELFPTKRCYQQYEHAVEMCVRDWVDAEAYSDVAAVARELSKALDDMYAKFFGPLCSTLDRLRETFESNYAWLTSGSAEQKEEYAIHILELKDVIDDLNDIVADILPDLYVERFVEGFINNPAAWVSDGNELAINALLTDFVVEAFPSVSARSISFYLQRLFPEATPQSLSSLVRDKLLDTVYKSAAPMFWADPLYNIAGESFPNCSLSVPRVCNELVDAAQMYASSHNDVAVRQVGNGDKITVARLYCGVPFFAYQGVQTMYEEYQRSRSTSYGVGSHLYAKTGRGNDGSGDHDWRHELPVPMPYSRMPEMFPDSQAKIELYQEGLEEGVIHQKQVNGSNAGWVISYSDPVSDDTYALADFTDEAGAFSRAKWEQARTHVQQMMAERVEHPQKEQELRDDGLDQFKERVRRDYFLHFRHYQEITRDELVARKTLSAQLAQIEAVGAEVESYERDVSTFMSLVFARVLSFKDGMGQQNYSREFTRTVEYDHADAVGMVKTEFLAPAEDSGFLKDHALFRAFRSYREMDPTGELRLELDQKGLDFAGRTRIPGVDNVIANRLLAQFDGKELSSIDRAAANALTKGDYGELMRFYRAMAAYLADYRKLFPGEHWNDGVDAPLCAADTPAPAVSAVPAAPAGPACAAVPAPVAAPAPMPGTWMCACGVSNNGKFCQGCGSARPAPTEGEWACSCGAVNTGKFCPECGSPRPAPAPTVWVCPCGTSNTGKFCQECGRPRPL